MARTTAPYNPLFTARYRKAQALLQGSLTQTAEEAAPLPATQPNNKLDLERQARQLLRQIASCIENHEPLIPLSATLSLTKAPAAYNTLLLQRDTQLEQNALRWLDARAGSFAALAARYEQAVGEKLPSDYRPKHYACQLLAGEGSLMRGENVFMYFPQCLGLEPLSADDMFGFELINVTSNLFSQGPWRLAERLLAPEAFSFLQGSLHKRLNEVIFAAALFHELGHSFGPYKVIPARMPTIKIDQFLFDVVGELWTESLLVKLLPEFPELAMYVTMQRLFWYPRRGFKDKPRTGLANQDNDALIGLVLWNALEQQGVLRWTKDRLQISWPDVPRIYTKILTEIQNLAAQMVNLDTTDQNAAVRGWLAAYVSMIPGVGYEMGTSQKQAFDACADIPEVPAFTAPLPKA